MSGLGQARWLKGVIALALIAAVGVFAYFYRRTAPGEPCRASWHCRVSDDHAEPECRIVAGRGKLCAQPCDKERAPQEACPLGLSCDQLVWDEGRKGQPAAQTAWFCLPK